MAENHYAKNITAEDLRLFLAFWPMLNAEAEESRQGMNEDQAKLLGDDAEPFAWCYLYDLPIKEHIIIALTSTTQNFEGMLDSQQLFTWLKQISDSPSQVREIPMVANLVKHHFESMADPSKELVEKMRPKLGQIFGNAWAMSNSLRCILYHGCFLNELVARVRENNDVDDKALFAAVRIDPTIIGCLSVSNRISKAALLKDNSFFAKLKAAINGKLAKREQANFQKMRLVFEVLHEAGATRLSDAQLHALFVKELKLYSGNAKRGGSDKALRKFADTYMKESART